MKLRQISATIQESYKRAPSEPSVLDMKKAFEAIDSLISGIEKEEMAYEGNTPVVVIDGYACEIAPAMDGWATTFERIARRTGADIDLGHLKRLGNRISSGMLIEQSALDKAKELINRCRAIYLACPTHHRIGATNETLIEVRLHELGFIREAA